MYRTLSLDYLKIILWKDKLNSIFTERVCYIHNNVVSRRQNSRLLLFLISGAIRIDIMKPNLTPPKYKFCITYTKSHVINCKLLINEHFMYASQMFHFKPIQD